MADNTTNQPATDDQELAKVLADMSNQAKQQEPLAGDDKGTQPAPTPTTTTTTATDNEPEMVAPPPVPAEGEDPSKVTPPPPMPPAPTTTTMPILPANLADIKKSALEELRPIVDKLDLPAEEKFDALLLVIRSSDDQSLVQAAYNAAENITDPGRKAQALLDIVKEIEYFSQQRQVPTTA